MLNISKGQELRYASLHGEFNLRGVNRASPEMMSNVREVIRESLDKPLSFISEMTYDNMPAVRNALSRVAGRNAYEKFDKEGPQYFAISKTNIACPEHITTDILSYVKVVIEVQDTVGKALPVMLNHLQERIGILYNDKQELAKVIDDFNKDFIDNKAEVAKLKKVMSTEKSKSTCAYKDLVKRNKDWITLGALLEQLMKSSGALNIKTLNQQVARLADTVDVFVKERFDTVDSKVSAATASNLGKAVFEIAECARLYGVVYSLVVELAELDKVWQERLSEISSDK